MWGFTSRTAEGLQGLNSHPIVLSGFMDSVVHFEIPAKDVKRASAFYSKVFGWGFNQFPGFEYWSVLTTASDRNGTPTTPGSINGGMGKQGVMAPKDVTITINVADIDAALETVKKNGGKMTGKKMPVGDMGFSAYFEDTEGNVIGLWQNKAM
jgi:predicted enzyme related to lactoylglutathione lyase